MKKILFLIFFAIVCMRLQGQTYYNVTHISGVQNIACTNVTVTISDDVDLSGGCPYGPYRLAGNGPVPPATGVRGTVTFTFNPGVSAVRFFVAGMEPHSEYASISVNGTHVDFHDPAYGTPLSPHIHSCGWFFPLPFITPSGI